MSPRSDPARSVAVVLAVVVVAVALVLSALFLVRSKPPMAAHPRFVVFSAPLQSDFGWNAPRWLRDYVRFCREPDTNTTQYLVWSCTDRYCGGAGDRARGMMTAFYLAVGTGRKIRLHSSRPVDMRLVLQPAFIDWSTNARELLQQASGPPPRLYGSEDSLEFAERMRNERVMSIFSSAQELYPIYAAPQFAERFAPSPDDPLSVGPDNWDVLATWAWTALFRETSALWAEIAALRHDADLHGPFIAVHVRHGGHWSDPLRHADEDVLPKFADCAARVPVVLGSDLPVYIASDDVAVKRSLAAALPDATVRYDPVPPQHLEAIHDYESQLRIWAEFILLRQATCVVASHSGYSLWPVATSRNPQTGTRCWARFDRCSETDIQRAINGTVPVYMAPSANDPEWKL